MDWLPGTNNTLFLDWADDVPRFVRNNHRGTVSMFEFEVRQVADDIFIPDTHFSIELSLQNDNWQAQLSIHKTNWRWDMQKARVYTMVEKINETLRMRSDIDLTEFTAEWLKQDPTFGAEVW